ncbi:tail fiber domain-containing protein [bacterium]|nr:tail fiber domain-containing protein [bacterium]
MKPYCIRILILVLLIPCAGMTQEMTVKDSDDNVLMIVNDEGTTGSISLPVGAAPSSTVNKLYNQSGALRWDGKIIATTSSVIQINDLSDGKTGGQSVFLGYLAGGSDDGTDNRNTAVGWRALQYNTSGNNSSAFGNQALNANTTGHHNTATGYWTLKENTTGWMNAAIGCFALSNNTTGGFNTALGSYALYSNVAASMNTAVGTDAMYTNTTGECNVADGNQALYFNTTGNYNATCGYQSLYKNTIGNYNTALGDRANYYNQEGSNNTIIGYEAGKGTADHTKSGNVFIGYQAGFNETGDNKLYIENSSSAVPLIGGDFSADEVYLNGVVKIHNTQVLYLPDQTDFNGTLVLGNSGGSLSHASGDQGRYNTAVGLGAMNGNTTGFSNTACGGDALITNTIGMYNTALGYQADVAVGDLTNATAIGWGAIADSSNMIRLGNTEVTVIEGEVAYSYSSDKNKKENFLPVDGEQVLGKIRQMDIQSWNYIGHNPRTLRHYGPVAQDFFQAFGHDEIGEVGTDKTLCGSDVDGINMIAIKALERRTAENSQLRSEVTRLEAEITELRAAVADLVQVVYPGRHVQ